jgi:adenine-specific DNA methylase
MKATQLSLLDQVEERVVLQEEDTRSDNLPRTYKGIYAMHKYWSKKPYNLIANYIKRYSSPGDIVIDTFCGSGVTVTESVRLKRRAIGIDINPAAVFITQMGLSHVDIQELKRSFADLKREVKPVIDSLYHTECIQCGNSNAIATHTIWEERPQQVWYTCSKCKIRKGIKAASEDDWQAAVSPVMAPRWYPTEYLIENSRINVKAGAHVSDLFTPRALVALSLLLEQIRQIKDENVRAVMEFCFSGALAQTSTMDFVIRRRGKTTGEEEEENKGKAEVGSWVIGYWVPSEHFEIHVWRCFENRFRRIVKGKQEINFVIPTLAAKCSSFGELTQVQEGYWVDVGNATSLSIPSETIDYAFVDPPHGNRIPYLELSLMWNAWLGLESDWENEIIVSEANKRQKNIEDYQSRLAVAFSELWRVLKPDKYVSVAFNSLDDGAWLSLLNAWLETGFEIREIQPLAYSARSVVQDTRKNALKTDFVITCQKRVPKKIGSVEFNGSGTELEREISNYLAQCVDGAETYQILNHLFVSSIPTGRIFKVSQILETLENRFNFTQARWYSNSSH